MKCFHIWTVNLRILGMTSACGRVYVSQNEAFFLVLKAHENTSKQNHSDSKY